MAAKRDEETRSDFSDRSNDVLRRPARRSVVAGVVAGAGAAVLLLGSTPPPPPPPTAPLDASSDRLVNVVSRTKALGGTATVGGDAGGGSIAAHADPPTTSFQLGYRDRVRAEVDTATAGGGLYAKGYVVCRDSQNSINPIKITLYTTALDSTGESGAVACSDLAGIYVAERYGVVMMGAPSGETIAARSVVDADNHLLSPPPPINVRADFLTEYGLWTDLDVGLSSSFPGPLEDVLDNASW